MTAPSLLVLLVFAAVLGLVVGSFLNVVVYRVPAGIPLTRESRCPHCGAPVRWWQNVPVFSWLALRGRCAACTAPISARYPLVEAGTAVAFAFVAWVWAASGTVVTAGMWPVLVAYLYFTAVAIALVLIDVRTGRLPDAIVLPSYLVVAGLFVLACLLGEPSAALLRAGIGMAALYALSYGVRLIGPRGMDRGDVRLAGVIGLALGWLGWSPLIVGAGAAFVLGIALIVVRRARHTTAIPFGPWLIAGAGAGLVAGDFVGACCAGMLAVVT